MLNKVRKFLRDLAEIRVAGRSSDWLNTEVNKDLLQNLTANIKSSQPPTTQTTHESQHINVNVLPSPFRRGAGGEVNINPVTNSDRQFSTADSSLFPTPGTPHWRRIRQVFQALDTAPEPATYNELIGYVRETTGQGCSRKLISKWKKQKLSQKSQVTSQKFPDNNSGDRNLEEKTAAIAVSQTSNNISSTVNSFQLTEPSSNFSVDNSLNRPSFLPTKALSYLAAASITIALVGWELIPLNNNRLTENMAIASVNAPSTPLPEIPERRKNRLEPRNIKIELTLSNPQDLKVKPGEHITVGQILSDRANERNRLQATKKQLQLSLEKLHLPLTPIPQPQPIPEIAKLPPVSYAEEEAAIKLKQQQLTEAERAIALQQKKIDSLTQLQASPVSLKKGDAEGRGIVRTGGGDIKLILEHEHANLKNLKTARQSAQIQLEVAQSKLTTAREQRAYLEYQRQLEQTRRAIALEQQHQAIQRQESERQVLLAEREYSKAQIETQIQTLDYQIHQLSTVTAPYEGTIKKVKWTGQSDHNLTAVITLAVSSDRSTIANSTSKPTPNTEVKQTTQTQP